MTATTEEKHIVKILQTEFITHNVKQIKVEKPTGYKFKPGQATDVSINQPALKDEKRPFSFTSLNEWDYLEFTIKIYNDHQDVTNELGKLVAEDELILHSVFGAINYFGEGVFIAGGAGVTPFIAILRQLQQQDKLRSNTLLFSNKMENDIILKNEFTAMLGSHFINTLTNERTSAYDNSIIDEKYLKEKINDFSQYFYLCGPDAMVENIHHHLIKLGADKARIIVEQF
ncbi:MAG: flavodoxin reductase [Chitinophagaceae bacterium]